MEDGQEGSDPRASGPFTRLYTKFAHAAGTPFRPIGKAWHTGVTQLKTGVSALGGSLKTAFNESSFGRAAQWAWNTPPVRLTRDAFNVAGLMWKSPPVSAVKNYVWPFRI